MNAAPDNARPDTPFLAMVERLTASTAPATARLVHRMGYRTHHDPMDGHGWEWRHPRHRQNNRWDTCPAYAATADEAWHNLVMDALHRDHALHDALVQTVLVEAEQQILRAEAQRCGPTGPNAPPQEVGDGLKKAVHARPRARL